MKFTHKGRVKHQLGSYITLLRETKNYWIAPEKTKFRKQNGRRVTTYVWDSNNLDLSSIVKLNKTVTR